MSKVFKMILLPLLLVSILSLPIAIGCNGDGADTSAELSQLELEEIQFMFIEILANIMLPLL